MNFRNIEQPEKLVLGGCLIVCEVRGTQNKPPFLPCLLVAKVSYECDRTSRNTGRQHTFLLLPFFQREPEWRTCRLWSALIIACWSGFAAFHPPANSSSSSSLSSPPDIGFSAIEESPWFAPGLIPRVACADSGSKTHSSSDSVPDWPAFRALFLP